MTQSATPETDPSAPPVRPFGHASAIPVVPSPVRAAHDLCPYLLAADGAWRSATPARDHGCAAVGVHVPLAPDKQRRLCLTEGHRRCPAYAVAIGRDPALPEQPPASQAPVLRPFPRTAPIALDHGRRTLSLSAIRGERQAAQVALAGLMAVAFVAIAFARLSGGGAELTAAGGSSPSPVPAGVAGATPSVQVTPSAVARISPSPQPSTSPTEAPVATPSPPPPSPSGVARTYRIRSGDTLSGIAAQFGTTVRKLSKLNGIDDPTRIRVGMVLQIP